jgi:hypothetical protein
MAVSTARKLKPLTFEVSTNLLDQIGVNMYSKYPKAIGELVVNAYDADANFVQVRVDQRGDCVEIEDNGSGMNEEDIRNQFMFIASRQKRVSKVTPIYGRLPIGQKGIGKLAGFGIAKCMEITTIKDEKQFYFRLDREELENGERIGKLREAVLNRSPIQLVESNARGKAPGTTVRLTKLRRECGRIDVDKIVIHLALELPQSSTFKVVVNRRECKRQDVPAAKRYTVDHVDPVCGPIKGEIIVAKKRLPEPGMLVTVRGRVVGRPLWFGVNREGWRFTIAPLITGSVEVPAFDPEEPSDGMDVIKTDREGFIETHPKFEALATYMKGQLEEVYRDLVKEYERREEQEKRLLINEAIRNVAADLNEWERERERDRRLQTTGSTTGRQDETGQEMQHPIVDIPSHLRRDRKGKKRGIPPKLMEEIRALLGSGKLRFAGRLFEVKTAPLGEDSPECDIRWEESLVIINLDHPAYEQARANRCVEITTFRAVAGALAAEECETAGEMYEELDSMIRFHAERMGKRARKGKADTIEDSTVTEAAP